jgi:pimeloyl-ACP methyl ester carboxylesterase
MQHEQLPGAAGLSAEWAWVARPVSSMPLRGAILLIHGFGITPPCYSALCAGLAESGFAVVAPHVYGPAERIGTEPSRVRDWSVRVGAAFAAPFILAGHSRGGQAVMLSLVKDLEDAVICPKVHAVILLDVVEGSPNIFGGLRPYLLRNGVRDWTLDMTMPVLVIGGKLGTSGRFPAAPQDHNYEAVWTDGLLVYCKAQRLPSAEFPIRMWKVVAEDFGHLDYLNADEDCEGFIVKLAKYVVSSGRDGRLLFRAFVVLVVSEFLNACALAQPGRADVERWNCRVEALRLHHQVEFRVVDDAEVASASTSPLVAVRATSWVMTRELNSTT